VKVVHLLFVVVNQCLVEVLYYCSEFCDDVFWNPVTQQPKAPEQQKTTPHTTLKKAEYTS
jgi:hypothetical protein